MNSFWRYSRDKCDQQVLEWLGGGLVVAATGLWLAFVDFFPRHDLGRRTSASEVSGRVFDMADNGASQPPSRGGPVNLAQAFTPPPEIRHDTLLVDGWRFIKSDVAGAEQENFNDQSWAVVSIPHTWNAQDGQDGGNEYFRGTGFYRRHFSIEASEAGRQLFIHFDGVNTVTDVWVNGIFLGQHRGGFGMFRFEMTSAARVGGDNVLAVRVSNAAFSDVAPLTADFTFFGGIYRGVHVITVDPVHVRMGNFASPGIFLTASNVTATSATLTLRGEVFNGDTSARDIQVQTTVVGADQSVLVVLDNLVHAEAQSFGPVSIQANIANPHLWQGRDDPYVYTTYTVVSTGGQARDMIVQPLGFRSVRVDAEQGFFLNENYLDLHGVNRHQDLLDHGWATSRDDDDRDFNLIAEIGATAVRLAHYQHNQRVYDLTDQLGLVVWAEIANVDSVNTTPEYLATTQNQLLELIRQNYNHPSIVFWGIGNELGSGGGPDPTSTVQSLNALARVEDPSWLTALATFSGVDGMTLRSTTDVIGYNVYLGWYMGSPSDFPDYIDSLHQSLSGRPLAVSEHGAGASVRQHQSPPSKPDPGGPFHPGEWQSLFHETYWKAMKTRRYLWGKFVWNMFDFASDGRNEGDTPGRNDKGLVTYDRLTRKDAFYWYKVNWSGQPTVYITERRYDPRPGGNITVRVYSNLAQIELKVNGASQGVQTGADHIFSFNITLTPGTTAFVEACGNASSGSVCDSVSWTALPPLDMAAKTQSNLGAALYILGKRESSTAKLEAAVAAHREALKELTREHAPFFWAMTQENLGVALRSLAERESGTANLEAAVAAHREALTERTRDRVPLDWATSFGNEGVALMLLAERRGDLGMAETAVSQINTAFETMRGSGPTQSAAELELMLSNARTLVARLSGGEVSNTTWQGSISAP
jgi:beta-galactosidase